MQLFKHSIISLILKSPSRCNRLKKKILLFSYFGIFLSEQNTFSIISVKVPLVVRKVPYCMFYWAIKRTVFARQAQLDIQYTDNLSGQIDKSNGQDKIMSALIKPSPYMGKKLYQIEIAVSFEHCSPKKSCLIL